MRLSSACMREFVSISRSVCESVSVVCLSVCLSSLPPSPCARTSLSLSRFSFVLLVLPVLWAVQPLNPLASLLSGREGDGPTGALERAGVWLSVLRSRLQGEWSPSQVLLGSLDAPPP